MWEAPSRDRGAPESRGAGDGDALGGPPDSSRPANPWPRLLAFAAVVATVVVLTGVCFVSYARPPERELRSNIAEFGLGVPKFIPVTTLGADASGRTYGAWVTLTPGPPSDPTPRPATLLSKVPGAGCHVRWEPTAQAAGITGVFVDPCSTARYSTFGRAVEGTPMRDLDAFPAHVEGQTVIVNLMTAVLGACRAAGATDCSVPRQTEVRRLPSGALPLDFGRR
ncbi:MAG: hypothetical protein EXR64_00075 [Dehalococcoidia bacterium]|nr:hypothetical protein [Dehalococcoidia bacterium]